jgi:outer membrane immunogenic protein
LHLGRNNASSIHYRRCSGNIGYAFNRWLPYFTGGWGWGKFTSATTVGGVGSFNASDTHGFWTVGGGVEAALWGSWSAKAEYLYMDTGHITNTFLTPIGTLVSTARVRDNIARVGLNYRFF